MKERKASLFVAVLCVALGVFCIFLRIEQQINTKLPPGESMWRLHYDIVLQDVPSGARLKVGLPLSTPSQHIYQEKFSRSELSLDVLRNALTGNREVVASSLVASSEIRFQAEFLLHLKHNVISSYQAKLSPRTRQEYLANEAYVQTKKSYIKKVLNKLNYQTTEKKQLLEKIFDYCFHNLKQSHAEDNSDALRVLKQKQGSRLGCSRAMIALCRRSQIPARLVTGFILEPDSNALPHYWVEAYLNKTWIPCDLVFGYYQELPGNYLPVQYQDAKITKVQGVPEYHYTYQISASTREGRPSQQGWVAVFDLTRLPPDLQRIISLLLLLPCGALITIILRNIIGVKTFGTFTPTLLALSFVYADWRTAFLLFALIMGLGLTARKLLHLLKLLILPRLGLILSLVVITTVMVISLLDYWRLTPTARTVVLPIIILTMLIEHFYTSIEEDGYSNALKLLMGTIVVTFCSYVVLRWEDIGRLALLFPEGQLFLIACLLLFGHYAGYRLTEWIRFKDLVKK